MCELDN